MSLKSPSTLAREYFESTNDEYEKKMYEKIKKYTVFIQKWSVCSCFGPEEVLYERGKRDYDIDIPLYVFEWANIHMRNPFEFSGGLPTREPQKTVYEKCLDSCYFMSHFSDEELPINDNQITIVYDDFEHSYSDSGWAFWIGNEIKDDAFSEIEKCILSLSKYSDKNIQKMTKKLLESFEIYKYENEHSVSYTYIERNPDMKLYKDKDEYD